MSRSDHPTLFGPPDPFDDTAWFGMSCKVVWLAVVGWRIQDWARTRRWQG